MDVTIRNKGPGMRVFKNLRGQDIPIQPGDSRSFDIHPHHLKILKREVRRPTNTIELDVAEEDLRMVDQPGGDLTDDDKARLALKQLSEEERLAKVRQNQIEQRFFIDPKTVPSPVPKEELLPHTIHEAKVEQPVEPSEPTKRQRKPKTVVGKDAEVKPKGQERVKLK